MQDLSREIKPEEASGKFLRVRSAIPPRPLCLCVKFSCGFLLTWILFFWEAQHPSAWRPKKKQRQRDGGATKSQECGFHSARARGESGLFPELLPLPDAGSFVEDAVAELVGQHQNLTAMMRLVR